MGLSMMSNMRFKLCMNSIILRAQTSSAHMGSDEAARQFSWGEHKRACQRKTGAQLRPRWWVSAFPIQAPSAQALSRLSVLSLRIPSPGTCIWRRPLGIDRGSSLRSSSVLCTPALSLSLLVLPPKKRQGAFVRDSFRRSAIMPPSALSHLPLPSILPRRLMEHQEPPGLSGLPPAKSWPAMMRLDPGSASG